MAFGPHGVYPLAGATIIGVLAPEKLAAFVYFFYEGLLHLVAEAIDAVAGFGVA